ncbi:hypothetical protein EsH8_V_000529 [Colletotrichum jinshuiense]
MTPDNFSDHGPRPLALLTLPTEILNGIFIFVAPLELWRIRRTSKRFNAILHPHLLSSLRSFTNPLPKTLIRETVPVPISFVYNLILALLGHDEGHKLWRSVLPYSNSRNTASPWLPLAKPIPPSTRSEVSPANLQTTAAIQSLLDPIVAHIRASSADLPCFRKIHFWTILLWYKEWSAIASSPLSHKRLVRRRQRLEYAYKQDRATPTGQEAAEDETDEKTRTYLWQCLFNEPPPKGGRRSYELRCLGHHLKLEHWVKGIRHCYGMSREEHDLGKALFRDREEYLREG